MIIVFYVLLIVFLLTLTGFIFIIYTKEKKNLRTRQIRNLKTFFNDENFFLKMDSILSRMKSLSENNFKIKKLYEQIYSLFDYIHKEINKSKQEIVQLEKKINTTSKKDFVLLVQKWQKSRMDILSKEKTFFELTKKITKWDNVLRKDMNLYSKHLRLFLSTYKNKRVLLNKIAKPIENVIKESKNTEEKFKINMHSGNLEEAFYYLNNYFELVMKIGNIIDKGPTIQTFLFKTIPLAIQEISKIYNNFLNNNNGSLRNINFNASLEKIANTFLETKENFNNLKIENCTYKIKEILKTIKVLKELIESEIHAQKIFFASFDKMQKEMDKIEKYNVYQNNEIRKLLNKGFVLDENFLDINLEIKEWMINLKKDKDNLEKMKINKDIPFSSKLFRIKKVLQQNQLLIQKLKIQDELIYKANSLKIKLKNLYKQIEFALYQGFYEVKKKNLVITNSKKEQYEKLKKELLSLNEIVMQENGNRDIESKLKILLEKVSNFYLDINSQIQIANIINFFFEDFSSKRAIDIKLNKQFILSEESYLQGDYVNSLKLIIDFFETRGKNV